MAKATERYNRACMTSRIFSTLRLKHETQNHGNGDLLPRLQTKSKWCAFFALHHLAHSIQAICQNTIVHQQQTAATASCDIESKVTIRLPKNEKELFSASKSVGVDWFALEKKEELYDDTTTTMPVGQVGGDVVTLEYILRDKIALNPHPANPDPITSGIKPTKQCRRENVAWLLLLLAAACVFGWKLAVRKWHPEHTSARVSSVSQS